MKREKNILQLNEENIMNIHDDQKDQIHIMLLDEVLYLFEIK
jgi:hypothetical protein